MLTPPKKRLIWRWVASFRLRWFHNLLLHQFWTWLGDGRGTYRPKISEQRWQDTLLQISSLEEG
jgi:hypothetical protein